MYKLANFDYRYLARTLIQSTIYHVNKYLLFNFKYAIVPQEQYVSHSKSIIEIKNLGLEILNIYDLGAHKGHWSRDLKKLMPISNFYLFEANAKQEPFLISTGMEYSISLLGEYNSKSEFFEIGGTGDSMFREKSENYQGVDPIILDVVTLDYEVEKKNYPAPDFIKIDCQGAELLILKGAVNTLLQTKAILVETQFYNTLNEKSPNFTEVVEFLDEKGFSVFDICEIHRHQFGISQIDFLFLNRTFLVG